MYQHDERFCREALALSKIQERSDCFSICILLRISPFRGKLERQVKLNEKRGDEEHSPLSYESGDFDLES